MCIIQLSLIICKAVFFVSFLKNFRVLRSCHKGAPMLYTVCGKRFASVLSSAAHLQCFLLRHCANAINDSFTRVIVAIIETQSYQRYYYIINEETAYYVNRPT